MASAEEIKAEIRHSIDLLPASMRAAFYSEVFATLKDEPLDLLLSSRLAKLIAMQASMFKPSDENVRALYKEHSDEVRHFSSVRSALTTFLVTAALTSFAAYFNKSIHHPFLIFAGTLFAIAAPVVSYIFSARTTEAWLRRRAMWKHLTGETPLTTLKEGAPGGPPKPSKAEIRDGMSDDSTNLLLIVSIVLILAGFYLRSYIPFLDAP